MSQYDVVISGYGPTGAVAANLLGKRGLRVLVVDQSDDIFQIPRAVHFDGEVARIFQLLGLSDEVQSVSGVGVGLGFVNGSGRTLMATDASDFQIRHAWPPANFFNQPALEGHLRRGAARFPSVEVRLGCATVGLEQDAEEVRVRIQPTEGASEEVSARYLLGCDGASSPTRELAGLSLEDLDCDEPWLVCDLLLDEGVEFSRVAYQICDWRRPTTLVPCEGQHIRWEFMLRPDDDPASLEREETARAMMAPHLHRLNPAIRPEDGVLLRSKVYTFHGLVGERFQTGRIFILGDAAHQTPPFLGQGMCAGIRDAFNLCWKIDGVLGGRFHSDLLETYSSEREPHARAVVKQAIRTGRVIQTTRRSRAFLRDLVFAAVGRFRAVRSRFFWEPAWPLGPGLFDPDELPGADTPHGNPIDQPIVGVGGRRARLDDLYGSEFALLTWEDPVAVVDEDTAKALAELPARVLYVVPAGTANPGPDAVVDVDGGLARWLERVGAARAVLLRPDREVFGAYGGRADSDLRAEIAGGVARLASRLRGGGRTI
jgi:3-(3-hydroxy-phenyl)propionate hydroxylase